MRPLSALLPCFALLWALFPPRTYAQATSVATLTAPAVLEEAKKGRSEMLIALGEMERYAPQITTSGELYGFLAILDPLDAVRAAHGFDDFGANPVRKSGLVVTKQALKWIRYDKDDEALVDAFLRWSSNETRYTAIGSHSFYLAEAEDKTAILHWGKVIGKALATLAKAKAEAYVMTAYQEFQGTVVSSALRYKDLSDAEFTGLVNDVASVPALNEIYQTLEQSAYAADKADALRGTIAKTLATAQVSGRLTVPLPVQIQTIPGQIVQEAMEKILFMGEVPDEASLEPSLAVMRPRQYVDVSHWLTQLADQGIEAKQTAYVTKLSRGLYGKMAAAGMVNDLKAVKKVVSQAKVAEMNQRGKFEGTYAGTVNGREAYMTIVNSSPTSMIIGLDVRDGGGSGVFNEFSYKFVTYDPDRNEFEASRFSPDDPHGNDGSFNRNAMIRFKMGNGWVQGTLYANGRQAPLTMRMTRELTNYGARPRFEPGRAPQSVSGDYAGGRYRLLLTQNESLCSGALYVTARSGVVVDITLNSGFYNAKNGAVYLTSGEQDGGSWIQLRGQIVNGVFEGDYVVGGSGPRFEKVRMRRL